MYKIKLIHHFNSYNRYHFLFNRLGSRQCMTWKVLFNLLCHWSYYAPVRGAVIHCSFTYLFPPVLISKPRHSINIKKTILKQKKNPPPPDFSSHTDRLMISWSVHEEHAFRAFFFLHSFWWMKVNSYLIDNPLNSWFYQ